MRVERITSADVGLFFFFVFFLLRKIWARARLGGGDAAARALLCLSIGKRKRSGVPIKFVILLQVPLAIKAAAGSEEPRTMVSACVSCSFAIVSDELGHCCV